MLADVRRPIQALALVLLFLQLAGPATAARPNVLVIETDDQTVADMAALPYTRAQIGSRGTTFANSFVSLSQCCPSRATLLTGQYAHNHGVLDVGGPFGGYDRLDGSETLAVWLRRAGYSTALVGKYLNGYRGPEVPPGWSEFQRPRRGADPHAARPMVPVGHLRRAARRPPARPRRPRAALLDRPRAAPPGGVHRRADAARNGLRRGRRARQAARDPPQAPDRAGAARGDPGGVAPADGEPARGRRRRGAAARRAARREHAGALHLRQRLPARRAPRAVGEGPALRAVDPRAAADARGGWARNPARGGP